MIWLYFENISGNKYLELIDIIKNRKISEKIYSMEYTSYFSVSSVFNKLSISVNNQHFSTTYEDDSHVFLKDDEVYEYFKKFNLREIVKETWIRGNH